jgi:hypothetical protein
MMNKKEITTFAKKIVRAQQGLKNHQLMHPRREWLIGVLVAVSIFSASAVWSSIKYFQYKDIDHQTSVQPEAPVAVYRENLVNEALSAFAEKAQRLADQLGDTEPLPEIEYEPLPEEEEESGETAEDAAVSTEEQTPEETVSSQTDTEPDGEVAEDSEDVQTPEENPEEVPQEEPEEDVSVQPATNI